MLLYQNKSITEGMPGMPVINFISSDYVPTSTMEKLLNAEYATQRLLHKTVPYGSQLTLGRCIMTPHVLNLVVRCISWGKPSKEYLISAAHDARNFCLTNGITRIAVVREETALPGIAWFDVYKLLTDAFENSGIDVHIYNGPEEKKSAKEHKKAEVVA